MWASATVSESASEWGSEWESDRDREFSVNQKVKTRFREPPETDGLIPAEQTVYPCVRFHVPGLLQRQAYISAQ